MIPVEFTIMKLVEAPIVYNAITIPLDKGMWCSQVGWSRGAMG